MFNKSGIIFKVQMEGGVVVLAVYKSGTLTKSNLWLKKEKLTNLWLKRKEKRRPMPNYQVIRCKHLHSYICTSKGCLHKISKQSAYHWSEPNIWRHKAPFAASQWSQPRSCVNKGMELGSHEARRLIFWISCSQQLFLWTLVSVFLTFLPKTVERAGCNVRKLLCTGWLSTTVIQLVTVSPKVAVLFAFVGRSAWDEHYIGTLPPSPLPPPWNSNGFLWMLSPLLE